MGLRPRFRTRREFHQINSVSSLLESSLRMAAPSPTTTSRKSPPFTWYFVFVEVCRSLSRPSPARLSLLMSSHPTPSITLRLRFRTRRESLQINSVSSSLESSSRTAEPSLTTISRRSPPFTWYSVSAEVCRSLSRPSPARLSLLMSSHPTPSITLRLRFRTRREFHLINNALSLL